MILQYDSISKTISHPDLKLFPTKATNIDTKWQYGINRFQKMLGHRVRLGSKFILLVNQKVYCLELIGSHEYKANTVH